MSSAAQRRRTPVKEKIPVLIDAAAAADQPWRPHLTGIPRAVDASARSVLSDFKVATRKSSHPMHAPPVLLKYHEIQSWQQDNQYILAGYRPESRSAAASFASWAYLHNESFNIYSHLIPAVGALVSQFLLAQQIGQTLPNAQPGDYVAFSVFLWAAFATLTCSFLYHTLLNHSVHVSHLWLRIDYVGIVILTLGDFVSGIYLVFYCEPVQQKIYWAMTVALGALTCIFVLHPRFQGLQWRALRVVAFVTMGLSGLAPLGHGLIIHGFQHMWMASGMPYYLIEGGLLLLGAIFYSSRCPERVAPGKFDFWGCSHNIFHVLIVLATTVHLVGIWDALKYNHERAACLP